MVIETNFFDRDAVEVAKDMLGKVLCRNIAGIWRYMRIIETEAYYITEKGSHASLGYTYARRALFMKAGTIYMYHSRGGDSLNISCKGEGNAVLIKSGTVHADNSCQVLNNILEETPIINRKNGTRKMRKPERICSGQALLCKALKLKREEWNAGNFHINTFYMKDIGYKPTEISVRPRLGIPVGRDEDLLLRFIDKSFIKSSTQGY